MAKKKATKKKVAKKAANKKPSASVANDGPKFSQTPPPGYKGIESLVWAETESLNDNPQNWKTHPERQLEALDAEIKTVGWASPLLYNLNTNRLVDGHGRKRLKPKYAPVLLGRWTEEEERQILLHLDPLAAMFETDVAKFDELTKAYKAESTALQEELDTGGKEALDALTADLEMHADAIEYGAPPTMLPSFDMYSSGQNPEAADDKSLEEINPEEQRGDLEGMYNLKQWHEIPFDQFGKGRMWGIPCVHPDRLASSLSNMQCWVGPETPEADHYFYIYGSAAVEKVRSNKMIVAFYTHDHKFESIWNDCTKITARMMKLGVHAVCSPNYSIWNNCPFAFEVWQVYRTAWLSCYWQSVGLNVIPDIQLSNFDMDDGDNRLKLRTCWLPPEVPCFSIQVQQKGDGVEAGAFYNLKKVHLRKLLSTLKTQQIICYHGPDFPKGFFQDVTNADGSPIEIFQVPTFMWERGRVLKNQERLTS